MRVICWLFNTLLFKYRPTTPLSVYASNISSRCSDFCLIGRLAQTFPPDRFLSLSEPWYRSMTACPIVSLPWCLRCWWTCWAWRRCFWVSLRDWRSKAETSGTCWSTQELCWCCFPWQAGSCGTVATSKVCLYRRSTAGLWVTLWTDWPALWVAGYGSPGHRAALHRIQDPTFESSTVTLNFVFEFCYINEHQVFILLKDFGNNSGGFSKIYGVLKNLNMIIIYVFFLF